MADQFYQELSRLREHMDEKLDDMKSDMHQIKSFIIGEGSDDKPGVIVKVDRLEQANKSRNKWLVVLTVTVLPLLISKILELF